MIKTSLILVALSIQMVCSRPQQRSVEPRSYQEDQRPAQYNFGYAIKDDATANNYGHSETRDGDVTKGSYFVQLPDGRIQTVNYYVNGNGGFVAEVSYEGEAKYSPNQGYRHRGN